MKEMEEKGFSKADLKNKNLERTKLEDLDFLRNQVTPGPFTTSEEVKKFMESEPESDNKNRRMYHEVRFQRNTSQALKKEAAVFRLKRDSRNLLTTEYASNLCHYLDQSRSVTNLTMCDLRNVLTGLNGVIGENRASVTQENMFQIQICISVANI